jgi:hypothetical protein
MSKEDYTSELLWEQMLWRKNVFLKAMEANDVSMLPRVRMHDRRLKCTHCPFYGRCICCKMAKLRKRMPWQMIWICLTWQVF